MITLFGATGYTGQKIAHLLDQENMSFRIAGRSQEKLGTLSSSLASRPGCIVADATMPRTLPALFRDSSMLINCAGPFTDLGERVIAQSAMSGTHYMDLTNELGFVFRSRTYHEMASRSGAALVPANGFEVSLADCAAHILGSEMVDPQRPEPLDEVNVVYSLQGKGASVGTRKSAVRSLATSWIAYRDGDWTGQVPGGKVSRFSFSGNQFYALMFPSSESVTIPQHLPVHRVDAWMRTTSGARFWAPLAIPLFARLSRSIFRSLILKIAESSGISAAGTLDVGLRVDSPFLIYVEIRHGSQVKWMSLSGSDPYGLTARIAIYSAKAMTETGYTKKGWLAPSQALDSVAFIEYAQSQWGVTIAQGEGK